MRCLTLPLISGRKKDQSSTQPQKPKGRAVSSKATGRCWMGKCVALEIGKMEANQLEMVLTRSLTPGVYKAQASVLCPPALEPLLAKWGPLQLRSGNSYSSYSGFRATSACYCTRPSVGELSGALLGTRSDLGTTPSPVPPSILNLRMRCI